MAAANSYQAVSYTGAVNTVHIEKQFLRFLRRRLVGVPLAKPSTLPENMGKTVRWNYFVAPVAGLANITADTTNEGLSGNAATGYTLTSTTATLLEFKNWMSYSKVFQIIAQAGSVDEISRVMAYEAALSMDTHLIVTASATSNSLDSGAAMTADFLRQGVAALVNADVMGHPDAAGLYVFIASGEAAYDMLGEGAPVWFQAKSSDYQAALVRPLQEGDLSSQLYNAIVKISNNIVVSSSNDQNLLIGNEGIGFAALATDATQPRVINTSPEQNVANPVRSSGTLGWWALGAGALLQSTAVCKILSDAGVHTNTAPTYV